MFRRSISAGLAVAIAFLPLAAVAECLTKAERAALELRALQTELMVATLSCRAVVRGDIIGDYNSFARKNEKRLMGSSRILVNYFDRRYGAQGRKQHDSFITALANDYSRRSMASASFCETAPSLLREAAQADTRGLDRMSGRRGPTTIPGADDCAIAAVEPTKEKR